MLPTTDLCEPLESHGKEETSLSPEAKGFRKYFEMNIEKTEDEREEKKPSVFDLAAEQKNNSTIPFPHQQMPLQVAAASPTSEIKTAPLSEIHCDWLVKEATSAITHTIQNGVKETSLRLDGPAFANSPFQGIELIVKEFTTAPLTFNIEFRGSSAAISSLKPYLPDLKAAFYGTHRPEGYAIHRIETSFEDSSPFLFHRKPPAEGGSVL